MLVELIPKLLHFSKLCGLLHFLPQPSNIFTQIYLPYLWHFATLFTTLSFYFRREKTLFASVLSPLYVFWLFLLHFLFFVHCRFVGRVVGGGKKGGVDLSSRQSPQINIKNTLHFSFLLPLLSFPYFDSISTLVHFFFCCLPQKHIMRKWENFFSGQRKVLVPHSWEIHCRLFGARAKVPIWAFLTASPFLEVFLQRNNCREKNNFWFSRWYLWCITFDFLTHSNTAMNQSLREASCETVTFKQTFSE